MDPFNQILLELEQLQPVTGIIPTDVLELPDPIGSIIRLLIRRGSMTLSELAEAMGLEQPQAQQVGELLTRKGFLGKEYRSGKEPVYRAYIARMRRRNIPLEL